MPHNTGILSGRHDAGFTFSEMVFATALFVFVISAVSDIFLSAYHVQRQGEAFLNMQNNVRFSLEAMAREMRTGTSFSSSSGALVFTNQSGVTVAYQLAGSRIQKCDSWTSGCVGSWSPTTASDVTISNFNFDVIGAGIGDGRQPRVTLSITVSTFVNGIMQSNTIQTTVTQRDLDS